MRSSRVGASSACCCHAGGASPSAPAPVVVEYVELPQCGHLPQEERPEDVVRSTVRFVTRHCMAGGGGGGAAEREAAVGEERVTEVVAVEA